MRGLDAWPLQNARATVVRYCGKRHVQVAAKLAQIAQAAGRRVRREVREEVAVVDRADSIEVIADPMELFFEIADPNRAVVIERDFDDCGFDQYLGEDDIELRDNLFDGFHVLARGVNEQRVGALIRNHFCLVEHNDFTRL